MTRHLFVGMDDEAAAKRSLIFTVLVVVFLLCVLTATSFLAGYEWRNYLAAEERRAEAMKPKKVVERKPVQLIECSKSGLEEWHRTCRARFRMMGVK